MKHLDLDILLQEGEGTMLEYKENLSSSFARELVAMANTAGGKILLGGMKLSDLGRKSIRRNALIADLLHRITFIEKAGTGIKRMRDEAHDQGCPEPIFEENGFFTAIFHPNPEVRAQADTRQEPGTAQVPPKYPPSTPQVVAMLAKAENGATRDELQKVTGLRDRKHFRVSLLDRFIQEGILEMTIPEKTAQQ